MVERYQAILAAEAAELKKRLPEGKLADMFERCYLNTIDEAVKELEDGSLEFSLDWSDGYLSPLLLCTSICASLGDESRLRALLRLSKTAQHFADGQVCP